MSGRFHGRVAITAMVISFMASSLLIFTDRDRFLGHVLFFENTENMRIDGEVRYLPRRTDRSEQLRLLVDELILGPRIRENHATLPQTTKIRSLMLRGDKLYLDLSVTALIDEPDRVMRGPQRLHALARTLRFNFPWLSDLFLLVDGQEPLYELPPQGWGNPCC